LLDLDLLFCSTKLFSIAGVVPGGDTAKCLEAKKKFSTGRAGKEK